jgi:hypothetical protein
MKDCRAEVSGKALKPRLCRDPFGRIPNSVVLDPQLSDRGLALLAYRLTKVGGFALSIDAAAIGLPLIDKSKGRKIGQNQFKRLIRELTQTGYLERFQPSSRGRSSFSYAVETVKVPQTEVGQRICRESWHDGSLSAEAIAGLLFIRAHNYPVDQFALRKRFGWGKNLVRKIVRDLIAADLIRRLPGAKNGYRDTEVGNGLEARVSEGDYEKANHEKASRVKPPHTRKDLLSHNDKHHEEDDAPRSDYGCVAKATKPEPFPDEERRSSERQSSLVDPWEYERILGWTKNNNNRLKDRLSWNELSHDTMAEVECVSSDDEIIRLLDAACAGCVHPDILSPAGVKAIRLLAAILVEDQDFTAQGAVDEILTFIQERIGAGSKVYLNSLKLITIRVAGSLAGGDQGLLSDTKKTLSEIRAADRNGLLNSKLFEQPRQFKKLCKVYGKDAVVNSIQDVIRAGMMDGTEPASIKTWDYFKSALDDESLKRRMIDDGMRPGDILGLHRTLDTGQGE